MTTQNVTVNYGTKTPKPNLSGFLHGSGVLAGTIAPLKPKFFRLSENDPTALAKSQALGCISVVNLSDGYGYPGQGTPWGGNPVPYGADNYAAWETFVTAVATSFIGVPNVWFDIWNEPDTYIGNFFWDGTRAQYQELYRRAVVKIRLLIPNAKIGGPCYANYAKSDTISFLNFCYTKNIKPDYITWHELGVSDSNIPGITANIQYFKSLCQGYPGFPEIPIIITEAVGPANWLRPGPILGWMDAMEKGGAAGAMKACWNFIKTIPGGQNSCFNGGLDGCIDPLTGQPLAAYWSYKTYADGIDTTGVTNRVLTTSDSADLVALASKTAATGFKGQLLLGYSNAAGSIDVAVTLSGLDNLGVTDATVPITIYKIPVSDETVVAAMTLISTTTQTITSNSVTFTISGMAQYEAYVVYVG